MEMNISACWALTKTPSSIPRFRARGARWNATGGEKPGNGVGRKQEEAGEGREGDWEHTNKQNVRGRSASGWGDARCFRTTSNQVRCEPTFFLRR